MTPLAAKLRMRRARERATKVTEEADVPLPSYLYALLYPLPKEGRRKITSSRAFSTAHYLLLYRAVAHSHFSDKRLRARVFVLCTNEGMPHLGTINMTQ